MGWIEENMKSTHIRQILSQAISLGMVISSALIIWKGLICIIGSESPVVVVLSGSMKPGFKRRYSKEADILTKDANLYDDRMLYTSSNRWLQQKYIMGRAVGKDPITFTYAYLRACRSQICGSNSKPCSKVFL
ncbi:hypothetical protein ERO13_D04G156300v2 [Gossypium hirsutum]|uniref:Peptidase S26 domain-containing protein n=1 Tax=Gossypium darwinii TaxID=34276 RepID=A0A5D2HNI2_GOSDA|nr:hypothetical protein ERO13_D04G156300v2 [Gossypium hirsutum]TYH31470.1 hypothetical protein ES288_A01G176100v1 [Gossypium darwinii]